MIAHLTFRMMCNTDHKISPQFCDDKIETAIGIFLGNVIDGRKRAIVNESHQYS